MTSYQQTMVLTIATRYRMERHYSLVAKALPFTKAAPIWNTVVGKRKASTIT